MVRARFGVDGGWCVCSVAAGRLCDSLRMLVRARWWGEDAARVTRRPDWREFAGTIGWPDGSRLPPPSSGREWQGAQSGQGARSNWASQGHRCGRCRVRRRAERVIRPAREKTRRRRVLVVTICSPRPMRAVQRARLWAITCTASQAALAAKRPDGPSARRRCRRRWPAPPF